MVEKVRKSATKPAKKKTVAKKKATASTKVKSKAKNKNPPATKKKSTVTKAKKKTVSKTVTRKAKPTPAKKKPVAKVKKALADKATTSTNFLINGKFKPYEINNDEEYMCEAQLNHFRDILNAWKHDLMEEVDHTLSEMKEVDNLSDLNDRASQEESFALELRTRDRERKLIRKIESAIQQIDDDDYGFCESCGVEIGIRRLEARPTASLCIECKTLAEIREKRS